MKKLLFALLAGVVPVPVFTAEVSASIGISQPGFYGQINIGGLLRPIVIHAEPMAAHHSCDGTTD